MWKVAAAGTETKGERGMTLLEVLFALLITSLISFALLKLYIGQYRLLAVIKDQTILEFALLRSEQVLIRAVGEAQSVCWSGGILSVIPSAVPADASFDPTDKFYVDDKDRDGKKDLYWERRSGVNPIATGITDMNCQEIAAGLWQITLRAAEGKEIKVREIRVRQRID